MVVPVSVQLEPDTPSHFMLGTNPHTKLNAGAVNWYPTTDPHALRPEIWMCEYAFRTTLTQKTKDLKENWDPTTNPNADSVPVRFGPTLTRDLV